MRKHLIDLEWLASDLEGRRKEEDPMPRISGFAITYEIVRTIYPYVRYQLPYGWRLVVTNKTSDYYNVVIYSRGGNPLISTSADRDSTALYLTGEKLPRKGVGVRSSGFAHVFNVPEPVLEFLLKYEV